MRKFNYERADSYEEAARLLNDDGAVMAGGTDILGGIKHDIFAEVPKTLVSIREFRETTKLSWTATPSVSARWPHLPIL